MIYLFYSEGHRAFLGAHSSMNQIQAYTKQIPQHVESVKKILSSKASPRLVSRLLPRSVANIERIGNTCVSLAKGAEKSFVTVLDLITEVIEVVKVTQGGYEEARRRGRIELNVTRVIHEDMKREEEERRKHYEEIRAAVRKAQEEYSSALKKIPTGFKALALDLGRAVGKLAISFGQAFVSKLGGGTGQGRQAQAPIGGGANPSRGSPNTLIINFASRFADSVNKLIQSLVKIPDETASENTNKTSSKSASQARNAKELAGFKVIFSSFKNMVNIFPQNELKTKANNLIDRGIALVDQATKDKNADITEELQTLANEIKPFLAAEQLNSNNPQAFAVPSVGDSSNNELFAARLAQENLARQEQRVDAYYSNHVAAMEQIRQITEKLARLNIEEVHFTQIIEMLEEAFELLAKIQKNWSDLVLFFSGFANQVVTGFGEKLKSFIGTASTQLDAESLQTDREVIMGILAEDGGNLYHESYVLYVLSRTYYDVSAKYLMPRLSKLSSMLAGRDSAQRRIKLDELKDDTTEVEKEVLALIEERKRKFKQAVSERRAQITEIIDAQGADGNEDEIIDEAKELEGL